MSEAAPAARDEERASELVAALRRFLAALGRRRRELAVVFVLVFAAVQALAFFWPATYAARGALVVEQRRGAAGLAPDPSLAPRVVSAGVTEEQVNSEIAIMKSRAVLEGAVRATGLHEAPPPWYLRVLFWPIRTYERLHAAWHEVEPPSDLERAIRGLGESLQVEHFTDSNVLVVTYEAGDPEVAEIVLDQVLGQYLAHHQRLARSEEVEAFFADQTDELEEEIVRLEEERAELETRAEVVDLRHERDAELAVLSELVGERAELERRLAELEARAGTYAALLEDGVARAPAASAAGQRELGLQSLKKHVLDLTVEQVRLEKRYKPGSPLIEENRAKLEAAREMLAEQRRRAAEGSDGLLNPSGLSVSTELAEARAEREGLVQRRGVLTSQLAAARERVRELDRRLVEADRIQRRLLSAEEKYVTLAKRHVDARINAALDARRLLDVGIVQEAQAEAKPVAPKKLVVLLVSTLGGVVAALLACVILEARALGLERMVLALLPREEREEEAPA